MVIYSQMCAKLINLAALIERQFLHRTTHSGGLLVKMCVMQYSRNS